jgi:hypothetical protein
MVVSEGRLISKKPFGGEPLTHYKKTTDGTLIEDFVRGVAVNTNYLSNIQVTMTTNH